MTRIDVRGLVLLLLGAAMLVMAFQGTRSLLDPDEGRYTSVALEMLRTGDFIHPALGPQQPHITKPPLTYWAIAAGIEVFGQNEWGARIPYALAFVLTVWLVVLIAARMGLRRPWWAGLAYALMFLPYYAANAVTTDTFLVLFETLAALGYVGLWQAEDEAHARRARRLMWLGFSLAFLTKGPPGLLPLAAFAVHAFISGGRWRGVRSLFDWVGMLLFLVIGLGWYAIMVATTPGLLDYYVENEIIGRVFSGEHRRNPQWYMAFVMYLPAMLVGSLPWTWLWLADGWRWWRRRQAQADDPARKLLLIWVVLPLAVFMLSKSRLVFYVLPLFVPLALWTALVLQDRRPGRAMLALLLGWVVALVAVKAVLSYSHFYKYARPLAQQVEARYGQLPIEHYAFVGTKSHFGLRFYTGKLVEYYHIKGKHTPLDDLMCKRVRNLPVTRLFFVAPGYAQHFQSVMQGCNVPLQARGVLRKMQVYESVMPATPGAQP